MQKSLPFAQTPLYFRNREHGFGDRQKVPDLPLSSCVTFNQVLNFLELQGFFFFFFNFFKYIY